MTKKWDPLAKPPVDASTNAKIEWLGDDVDSYRREHPELPQGDFHSLSQRQRMKIAKAYNRAREAAQVKEARETNPKMADALERAHRTGVIAIRSEKAKSPRAAAKRPKNKG